MAKDQLDIVEALLDRRNDWNYGKSSGMPQWKEEMSIPIDEELTKDVVDILSSYGIKIREIKRTDVYITYIIK